MTNTAIPNKSRGTSASITLMLIVFILVGVISYAALFFGMGGETHASADAARFQEMAKDCIEQPNCKLYGSVSSMMVRHSGMFVVQTALQKAIGISPHIMGYLALVLVSLSLVALAIIGSWLFDLNAGIIAALIGLYYLLSTQFVYKLDNTIALPFATAIFLMALLIALESRRWLFYLATACAFAVLVEAHPINLVFTPFIIGIFWRYRPAHATATFVAGVALFVVLYLSMSFDVIVELMRNPPDIASRIGDIEPIYPDFGLMPWVWLALALACANWFFRLSPSAKRQTTRPAVRVLPILAIGSLLFQIVLSLFFSGLSLCVSYYINTFLYAFALFVGVTIAREIRHALSVASQPGILYHYSVVAVSSLFILYAGWNIYQTRNLNTTISFRDGAILAQQLETYNIRSYKQAVSRLRSPTITEILVALEPFLPFEQTNAQVPPNNETSTITVLLSSVAPNASIPEHWTVVPLQSKKWLYLFESAEPINWNCFAMRRLASARCEAKPDWASVHRQITKRAFGHPEYLIEGLGDRFRLDPSTPFLEVRTTINREMDAPFILFSILPHFYTKELPAGWKDERIAGPGNGTYYRIDPQGEEMGGTIHFEWYDYVDRPAREFTDPAFPFVGVVDASQQALLPYFNSFIPTAPPSYFKNIKVDTPVSARPGDVQ